MEALIFLSLAWLAMMMGELVHCCVVSLARWLPVFAVGAIAAWIAHSLGAAGSASLAIGVGVSLAMRHIAHRCC